MWDEAARALGDLVAAAPRQAEVRFVMAYVALSRGQPEAALRDADDALALRAHYPEARLVRAEALAATGARRGGPSRAGTVPRRGAPTMVAERAQAARPLADVPR